ncbi:hypothetical protein [cyanobacterium endosymbiont of Rhopalodia gibberula]|uniref:hypothetical protein n=1 Tax=cyanobacterium endosymbiont of Rhopalodia gibberula TaxID=1763363 RepID=UPI000E65E991|nr:hypothetical protein [cyanobacterium endosymbiont of Rhopalodia gibberula]
MRKKDYLCRKWCRTEVCEIAGKIFEDKNDLAKAVKQNPTRKSYPKKSKLEQYKFSSAFKKIEL